MITFYRATAVVENVEFSEVFASGSYKGHQIHSKLEAVADLAAKVAQTFNMPLVDAAKITEKVLTVAMV